MADALCGPSNALQNFQKHSQLDRTLQQDRLTHRQPSHEVSRAPSRAAPFSLTNQVSQNFRSSSLAPNPQIEAEFEAFQRGLPAPQPFLPHSSAALPLHHGPHAFQPQTQPSAAPAWATDFQQLSLHEARQSPIPAAHFKHEAPLQRSSPSPWHTDFMRQDRTATPPLAHTQPFSPTFGQQAFGGMNQGHGFGLGGAMAHQNQSLSAGQADATFDDAAFAAAFDNAAAMFETPVAGKGKEKVGMHAREDEAREAREMDQAPVPEAFDMSQACVDPPEAFDYESYEENGLAENSLQERDDLSQNEREARQSGQIPEAQRRAQQAEFREILMEVQEAQTQEAQRQQAQRQEAQRQMAADQVSQEAQRERLGASLLDQQQQESAILAKGSEETKLSWDADMRPMDAHMADTQPESEQSQQPSNPQVEADDLSRTAGQLLDNLRNEHSEKFAKSNFMTLMRQLRDKEVRVDGERFVEVSQAQEPDHGSRGEFSARVWD